MSTNFFIEQANHTNIATFSQGFRFAFFGMCVILVISFINAGIKAIKNEEAKQPAGFLMEISKNVLLFVGFLVMLLILALAYHKGQSEKKTVTYSVAAYAQAQLNNYSADGVYLERDALIQANPDLKDVKKHSDLEFTIFDNGFIIESSTVCRLVVKDDIASWDGTSCRNTKVVNEQLGLEDT